MSTTTIASYEEAVANHEWRVPERYNIAAGRLRQAPARQARDDPRALRRDRARGALGRAAGALEPASPTSCARTGWSKRRPRGDAAAARRPRPPRPSSARGRSGRSCSRCRCCTATTASATGVSDSQAKVLVTDAANRDRVDASLVEHVLVLDEAVFAGRRPGVRARGHARRRPGAALLHVRHDRAWPRASCTRTATCSRTRSSSTATTCRTASASTAWASGPGPPGSRRCSGRGASAPSSSSTSARAASTRTSSSTSSRATRRRTSSRRRPRCAR